MELAKADEAAVPLGKSSSDAMLDSPPDLAHHPAVSADLGVKLKSTILRKFYAATRPAPSLVPESAMTPESLSSGASPVISPSAHSGDNHPNVEPEIANEDAASSIANYRCRACSPGTNETYPDRRDPWQEDKEGGEDPEWILCDHCSFWFHSQCVDLEPYESNLIDEFSCTACLPQYGPTTLKKIIAPQRHKYDQLEEVDLPMEVGTKPWVDDFIQTEATRFTPPPSSLVKVLQVGHDFEGQFERNGEWKFVYLILNKAGLGIKMPEPGEMWIDDMVRLVGEKRLVETIDVYRQQSVSMSVGRFRDLFNQEERPRLYNILSLEFTGTKLADIVRPPSIVQELSWAERYWPERLAFHAPDTLPSGAEETADGVHDELRPDVELFCLMGMGGSFTDFHIDFGGSSVWYHVYRGEKVFYIVEPTPENLAAYEKYMMLPNKGETFLCDLIGDDKCWRVVIPEGGTLLVPSGWIHAVYTPVDSLVFGGNYLTNLNVELQCEVYAQEIRCQLESRFMYPNFEVACWYAARSFTEMLREFNDDRSTPPTHIVRGAKALVDSLGSWIERDKRSDEMATRQASSKPYIHGVTQPAILAALAKEAKIMMKRVGRKSLTPPPPRIIRVEEGSGSGSKKIRISVDVPQVSGSACLAPLKIKVRKSSAAAAAAAAAPAADEDEAEEEQSPPITPKVMPLVRIRLDGATAKVVTEEERRAEVGGTVTAIFTPVSKSGRRVKTAGWVQDLSGREIDRARMEEGAGGTRAEERYEAPSSSKQKAHADEDPDYEALERAERGGRAATAAAKGGGGGRKRKNEKAPVTARAPKEKKTETAKQRLAARMKSLKK